MLPCTTGNVGDVNHDLTGTATTASFQTETPRNFTVMEMLQLILLQSFDGSGNVALPITLANSGVSAATYGSAAEVPVISVDSKGRIISNNFCWWWINCKW